ncbi:MAG: hypothetical protein RLP11_09115 [Marinoscillum sp.]
MSYFIHTVLVIGTFLLMEGVAWATHKYVMHGPLWSWHRSHQKNIRTYWSGMTSSPWSLASHPYCS